MLYRFPERQILLLSRLDEVVQFVGKAVIARHLLGLTATAPIDVQVGIQEDSTLRRSPSEAIEVEADECLESVQRLQQIEALTLERWRDELVVRYGGVVEWWRMPRSHS